MQVAPVLLLPFPCFSSYSPAALVASTVCNPLCYLLCCVLRFYWLCICTFHLQNDWNLCLQIRCSNPPPPRGYPFQPLLRTTSRFSPAVTALPADFRPLSLAAGHCGYCPLSLPLSMSRPLHMHIHMHRSDNPPPTSPSLLACYQIPVLRLLLFRVPGHLLCAVCAGMCLLSALCSLFFSTLSTTHSTLSLPPLFFCPAALYPFRHPLSPSASASQMLHF